MIDREVVAFLEGSGVLRTQDGKRVGCQYTVTIFQEIQRDRMLDGGESAVEGLRIIEGAVMGLDHAEIFDLQEKSMTLELEDGQYWECILTNTDGELVSTGKGL